MKTEQQKVKEFLANIPTLSKGLGTLEAPCSMAAINLALDGRLSDDCPDCASLVIWRWGIRIQDRMPESARNSPEWRESLCLVPVTGQDIEQEKNRVNIVLTWMWESLSRIQPIADRSGYGDQWRRMTTKRTPEAARAASHAADAASYASYASYAAHAAADAADAAYAAYAAAAATDAADAASYAVSYAANAASYAAYAAYAAHAAADAADAAYAAAAADAASYAAYAAANRLDYWRAVDPAGLLRRLCEV